MTMIKWFQKQPGESSSSTYDVIDEFGGPAIMIAPMPDWVKHPATGKKIRVVENKAYQINCPNCREDVTGNIVRTETILCCLDCPNCKQFIWFNFNTM